MGVLIDGCVGVKYFQTSCEERGILQISDVQLDLIALLQSSQTIINEISVLNYCVANCQYNT